MRTIAVLLSLVATAGLSLGQAPCCVFGSACCARAAAKPAACCQHCAKEKRDSEPAPKKCDCREKSRHLSTTADKHDLPALALLPGIAPRASAPAALTGAQPVREGCATGPPRPLSLPLLL